MMGGNDGGERDRNLDVYSLLRLSLSERWHVAHTNLKLVLYILCPDYYWLHARSSPGSLQLFVSPLMCHVPPSCAIPSYKPPTALRRQKIEEIAGEYARSLSAWEFYTEVFAASNTTATHSD